MAHEFHSPYWYQVESLRPKLPGQAKIERHDYRGQPSFIIQDRVNGRHLQLNPAARFIVGKMNGVRTIQQLWDLSLENLGDAAPGQEDLIHLLGSLYEADLLQCDIAPDREEFLRRYKKQRSKDVRKRWMNPLAIRFPLLDPEKFLTKNLNAVRWIFTLPAVIAMCVLIVSALVIAASHWEEIGDQLLGKVLEPNNLLLLFLVYPVVKVFHEFGHAFATRIWGGEVHEMGVTLLVLMPIPYVDASSANVFPEKSRRMVVGAAGMIVEWVLASLGLFIWVAVEPGIIQNIAWNVMLISGFSTLFFNGNPLLKFDGYYILSDAIEIPNLDKKSKSYLGYLTKKYLLGVKQLAVPAYGIGERRWLAAYGVVSTFYRLAILAAIILFIIGQYFIVGVLLALWAFTMQVMIPLYRKITYVLKSPELSDHRKRAFTAGIAMPSIIAALLFTAPFPDWTQSEGVIWLHEKAYVRASTDGFITHLLVSPDSLVKKGDVLIQSVDSEVESQVKYLEAVLDELHVRYRSNLSSERVKALVIQKKLQAVNADLDRAKEKFEQLTIRSEVNGRFVVPNASDLPGTYAKQGDVLGFVLEFPLQKARVIVRQKDADLVRQRTDSVELRLVNDPHRTIEAKLEREIPAASNQLPSRALGSTGGGQIAVNATDEEGLTANESVFQFELSLIENSQVYYIGSRVYVRFNHGNEPLGQQWVRRIYHVVANRIDV